MHPFPRLLGSRAFALLSFLSLLMLASCTTAHAQGYPGGGSGYPGGGGTTAGGHYTVAYSGGQCVVHKADGTTTTTPYGPSYLPPGWGTGFGFAASATVTCSGAITATFTWQPDAATPNAPPPLSVIVEQDCAITSYISGGVTGSIATGLGHSGGAGGVAPDTVYTVKNNPGLSFSISPPCAPSISLVSVATSGTSGGTLLYKASTLPVLLTLNGTTKDSSGLDNILIGQGCSGTLNAGPTTLSNFQWGPGPVFDQFLVSSDQSQGYATFLSAAALTQPSPHWHYLQDSGAGTFRVTCSATASINGTAIGTVTGQDSVKVWVPYYYMSHNAGPTTVEQSTSGGPYDHISTGGFNLIPPGMTFVGAVGTPALFSNSGTGGWLFVQLINTSHRQWSPVSPLPLTSGSGGLALDAQWPYKPGWPADSTSSASTPHHADDSPDLYLNNGYNEFAIADIYQMYMMYVPPGTDSQYVPLHKLTWEWNAQPVTIYEDGIWPNGASGTVTLDSDVRWISHPTWAQKFTSSDEQ